MNAPLATHRNESLTTAFGRLVRSSAEAGGQVGTMTDTQIIGWWELRRIAYNASLLVIGVAALLSMERFMNAVLPTSNRSTETLGLVLLSTGYVLGANLFYTFGWMIELEERKNAPEFARQRAVNNFRKGLLFSCGLTTLPFWIGLVVWLVRR